MIGGFRVRGVREVRDRELSLVMTDAGVIHVVSKTRSRHGDGRGMVRKRNLCLGGRSERNCQAIPGHNRPENVYLRPTCLKTG